MKKQNTDPLENLMSVVIQGFQKTTDAIRDLQDKQQQQSKATYDGMTGSGKSRYVAKLVEIEKIEEEKGAQARVARMLDLSPSRITQLIKSNKNRRNGK